AVKLSKRYISDRFLPDKAIDLIDEAASRYSANLDSMPLELNTLSRKISQLESEKSTLQVEDDSESILSLNKIEKEINIFNSELNFLRNQWEIERNILSKIKELRKNKEKNDKIITELIKELKLIQKDRKILRLSIEFEDIAQVISDWVKIPLSKLLEDEKSKLITMETKLQERVIGQNHVLRVISNAIRRARSGIQDPNRPIGSFIFMGPTGVGKTETAKALAEFLFNTDSSIIRIDMSEYMEKHSVARLIGAPPGYIGFDDGGYLTEAVRRKPYSIILLDEIEKANIEIFNILLQILDEGRLTDGKGRTVDFKNTVLILTSNIGSKIILEKKKISDEKSQIKIKELLKDYFKPEFLNRIDDTLVFNFLNKENVMDIADIQIKNLNKILYEKKIKIKFTEEGKKLLVDLGFNLQFGARELKRTIQNHIQDTLALSILNGEIKENNTILVDIDTTNRKFIFTKIE
ncbi:MAG: AAA domain-containing protein, partial [archaeon]|nr:AAA domain-containing protein [archaeon]